MKKSEFKAYLREEIISILSEESAEDIEAKTKAQSELNKELEKTKELSSTLMKEEEDDDEMDKQASSAAKKGDSVSKIVNKLGETTNEMKKVVRQYKDAEEPEKTRLLTRLKELTKIKNELEGLL
jgi:hypothetical protein